MLLGLLCDVIQNTLLSSTSAKMPERFMFHWLLSKISETFQMCLQCQPLRKSSTLRTDLQPACLSSLKSFALRVLEWHERGRKARAFEADDDDDDAYHIILKGIFKNDSQLFF